MTPEFEFDKEFSIDKIRNIIKAQDPLMFPEKQNAGPPIGFLPPGHHLIRWFVDPENAYIRELTVHNVGLRLRTHCPTLYQAKHPTENCPPCEICRLADEHGDWRKKPRFLYMVYGLVIETGQIHQYWQPGRSYLIIGQKSMEQALIAMVKTLLDKNDMALLEALWNPRTEGCATRVSRHKGSSGYVVDIQPLPDKTFPPITLGNWYQPLAQCWLPEAFSLEDYEAVLAKMSDQRS